MVKLMINDLDLNINKTNMFGDYPLLLAATNNNYEIFKLLIDSYNSGMYEININQKNKSGWYPLLKAISNNNVEMVKLLIKYAKRVFSNQKLNNIIPNNYFLLHINEKNENGETPLSLAICNNNIEIIKLLMNYSNSHNITLNLEGDKYSPFQMALLKNNEEIVELLIDYAYKASIHLTLDEKKLKDNIDLIKTVNDYDDDDDDFIKSISDIKIEIISLLKASMNDGIIKIIFSDY
eukprot:jgi/Orpsp1_1/1180252/evm.model.c7180000072662.2